jgi:aerobic carbon-monoxide dehydrogenase large subunit
MRRKEDPIQLLGQATFVDDIKLEGMFYCSIVRSPYAKATIKKIDKPKDQRLIDFLDGRELANITKPYSKFEQGDRKFEHRALAIDEVHFAGEPVAAVLAKSRYDAEDLIELVEVQYDTSDPVVDYDTGLIGERKVMSSWPNNIAFEKTLSVGDFDKALAQSAHHFEVETKIARQAAIPIEARGNVTIFNPEMRELTIWTPSKGPHATRATAAQVFSLREQSVQVKVPSIGGGFGVKAYYYPEEVVSAAFAIRNERPVKWISTRTEDLQSTMQARDQVHKTTICFDEDLRITGFKDEFLVDIGTPGFLSLSPSQRLVPLLGGCYKIPNIKISYKGIATNRPPMGPIRGNGRPEALLVTERAIEDAARKLGVDPIELRKRNLINSNELPYNNQLGSIYDSGNYEEALDRVIKSGNYISWRNKKKQLEDNGRLIGVGFSSYVEDTGGPPGKTGKPQYETALVRVERDGYVTAYSGSSPHGQGHETTFSEILARELSVDIERVRVRFGDTSLIPYGIGSMGSRSGPIGGSAIFLAAKEIKQKMIAIAAALLGCKIDEVTLDSGRFVGPIVAGGSSKNLSFNEVASAAYEQRKETQNLPKGLSAEVYFEPPALTFSFGAVLAIVEIDLETARPRLLSITALDDSGRIIDRDIVEGQIHGGIAHGIGNAILEEISYSDQGQPLASNLLDYMIPTSLDVPKIELLEMETPSTLNPLGVKGAGEGGTIGALPAVVNAISDALGESVIGIPVKPEEILEILLRRKRMRIEVPAK